MAVTKKKSAKKKASKSKRVKPPFNGSRRGLSVSNQVARFKTKFPMSKTTAEQYYHYAVALQGVGALLEAEALNALGYKVVMPTRDVSGQQEG